MKKTTVFKSGNSQAIRVPKELRLLGDEVLVEKVGPMLIILEKNSPWAGLELAQYVIKSNFVDLTEREKVNVSDRNELNKLFKK